MQRKGTLSMHTGRIPTTPRTLPKGPACEVKTILARWVPAGAPAERGHPPNLFVDSASVLSHVSSVFMIMIMLGPSTLRRALIFGLRCAQRSSKRIRVDHSGFDFWTEILPERLEEDKRRSFGL